MIKFFLSAVGWISLCIGTERTVPSSPNFVMPTSGIVAQSLTKKSIGQKSSSINNKYQRKGVRSSINHFSIQKSDKSSMYKPAVSLM